MIGVAVAAFLLLLAVVYLIARPFIAPLSYAEDLSLEQLRADRERLRAQVRELDADFETGKLAREEYERLRAQVRELDADFETGKLAREEYERLRARRLQQIEGVTRRIRELEPLEEPVAPTAPELDRELEARIAERKRLLAALEAGRCPGCGTPAEPEDRFCRRCGAALTPAEVTDP